MKRIALVLGIVASLAIGSVANASTYTFGDTANNWPGWGTGSENIKDTIGSPQINGGSVGVSNSGNLTNVTINTTGLTWHNEFYSGDLFINIVRGAGDTAWDYVVKSLGYTNAANNFGVSPVGAVGIYDLRGLGITTASAGAYSYVMSGWPVSADFRDNQPIGITSSTGQIIPPNVGDATFSGLTGAGVTYNFGNGLNLEGTGSIILGWTVNCGNDVLYEQVPVPEPGTMVLLGAGLLGLAIFGKRRMGKSA